MTSLKIKNIKKVCLRKKQFLVFKKVLAACNLSSKKLKKQAMFAFR
jgi:hypothetical protein